MSAIGDYIYYTYQDYVSGAVPPESDFKNALRHGDATKAFNQKMQRVRSHMQTLGDIETAQQLQNLYNMYSGTQSSNKDNISQQDVKVQQQINKAVQKTFKENKISSELFNIKDLTLKSPLSVIKSNQEFTNGIEHLKKNASVEKDLLDDLQNLLDIATKYKPLIESNTQNVIMNDNVTKRLVMLQQLIYKMQHATEDTLKAWESTLSDKQKEYLVGEKALQNAINWYHNNQSALSTGLHSYNTGDKGGNNIWNNISVLARSIITASSGRVGEIIELILPIIPTMAIRQAGYQIQNPKQLGNLKSANVIAYKPVNSELITFYNAHYKIALPNKEGVYIAQNETDGKVDVSFDLVDNEGNVKPINISAKYTSGNDFKILTGGVMYDLVALENQRDFVNHYINIMAPKFEKGGTKGKAAVVNSQDSAKEAMYSLLLAKALAGYNTLGYSSATNSIERQLEVNYSIIYSKKQGSWIVEPESVLYQTLLNNPSAVNITGESNTKYLKDLQPFPNTIVQITKDVGNDKKQIIKGRIAKTINFLHAQKLNLKVKMSALSK